MAPSLAPGASRMGKNRERRSRPRPNTNSSILQSSQGSQRSHRGQIDSRSLRSVTTPRQATPRPPAQLDLNQHITRDQRTIRSDRASFRNGSVESRPNDDENDDSLIEIVAAFNVRDRGTVGCAYYVAREEKLYCMEDVKMGGIEVVDSLRTYISPTTVIIPYGLDDATIDLLDATRSNAGSDQASSSLTGLPYHLEFKVAGEFRYELAKQKLMNLYTSSYSHSSIRMVVPGEDVLLDDLDLGDVNTPQSGRTGHLLRLGCTINLDSQLSVGCAGAVLNYIHRRRSSQNMPGSQAFTSVFPIDRVEMFTLSGCMFINMDTLMSLQVIQSEAHPHIQNQGPNGSGSKEGLSIYGLFQPFAKTPQGKALLRQYMLRPSIDLELLGERLDTITIMLLSNNIPTMNKIVTLLKPVKNIRVVVTNLRKGCSGGVMTSGKLSGPHRTVWASLCTFLYQIMEIKICLQEIVGADRLELCRKIMRTFDSGRINALGKHITDIIDLELSKEEQRIFVRNGIDRDLDQRRDFYHGIESFLSHVAETIARDIPMQLEAQISVVYYPQIGFLIAVPRISETDHAQYEGPIDQPWERKFSTEGYIYFKNPQMRDMDEEIGDVYGQICDREIEIIQELVERVLQDAELLETASDVIGELDALLALTQGAQEYRMCKPTMTDRNVLKIKGGRHLLQERTVASYIPNDTDMEGGSGENDNTNDQNTPSMLIITGPNYSGKSVYLKQVALITYLAHIGSYVPAQSATIGITDKILTRIWTRESVSRNQSAFMIDLQQMSLALNLATRRSLVIIDEFGKGTESYDGAGLAAGIFENLVSRGHDCPKVVAATHFHELFDGQDQLLPLFPNLAFFAMQIVIPQPSTISHPHYSSISSRHRRDISSSSSSLTWSTTQSSRMPQNGKDEIIYLYTLQPGRSSSSYGTICASRNGIQPHIISRAEELIGLAADGQALVAACAILSDEEIEDLRSAERLARCLLTVDFDGDFKTVLQRSVNETNQQHSK